MGISCEMYLDDSESQLPDSFIASLAPGDRIMLKAGYGYPHAEQDQELVIADVQGNSALTCDGTCLNCSDADGVELLEGKAEVVLSDAAKEILAATAP